jgi:hypothetical protein
MKIGLISEGRSDIAVLMNIIKACTDCCKSDVIPLVPEYEYDETDLATMNPENFSNWTLVKKACIEKTKFDNFITPFINKRLIIIQIDTAERFEKGYEVITPAKDNNNLKNNLIEIRNNVITKIKDWLNNEYQENIIYAIAIEEIESWLLTIYSNLEETGKINNPKVKFYKELNKTLSKKKKNILKQKDTHKLFFELSKELSKPKRLEELKEKNISLKLFCNSLSDKYHNYSLS